MPLILGTNSIKDTGYDVANSCRFDDGSSDSLHKTFSGNGNRKTFTFSAWVKRGIVSSGDHCLIATSLSNADSNTMELFFQGGDKLAVGRYYNYNLITNALFRDPSAWYHIVLACDTTQSTASNRMRLYVNGSEITSFATASYPSQNDDLPLLAGSQRINIAAQYYTGISQNTRFLDGYMTEVVMVDGQQLTPTSFGEFDEDSPTIWKPIDVSGLTFGTNGFYLDFEDSSALGNDAAGSNNFTVNNLTAVDQSLDTCTTSYATLNPLYRYTNNMTYSEGNLKVVGGGNSWQGANSTFYINKGKWFFEVKFASATDVGNFYIGWTTAGDYNISEPYDNGIHYYNSDGGEIYANSSAITTADYGTFANGNIMGMALDYDNSLLTVYKNGSALVTDYDFSSATTTAKGGNLVTPTVAHYGSGTVEWNFSSPSYAISSGNTDGNGYGNFEYAVPSGYYSLNTKNLAEFG